MDKFIFGGNTADTYAQIQRRRKIAEQFGKSQGGIPKTAMEGLHAVADALISRHNSRKADGMAKDFAAQVGYDSPIVQQLLGLPRYARGTAFHQGGLAIVGEEGPEIVNMPRGSQVMPNPMTLAYDQRSRKAPTGTPEGYMEPLPPSDLLREEMGDEMFRRYQQMTPEQQLDFLNNPNNGFIAPPPEDYNPTELMARGGNRFDDAASYQVAQADTGTMTDAAPQPSFEDTARGANLDLNVTQAQRSGQALRLLQAESVLRELENQGTRTWQDALTILPDRIENHVLDDDYRRFQQARDTFAEAAMRADTGATINESEWPRILKNLAPQPGDSPEMLAQRRAMRETFINSLIMSSGKAANIMPKIGEPVVPVGKVDPSAMSDEDLLRALQGGN